jgi:ParB family chromosome partitioning protein
MARKGLGRGFDSLIPTDFLTESFDVTTTADAKQSDLRYVKTTSVAPDSEQPRRYFEESALDELAASIAEHGILQPLVVSPAKGGKDGYVIIAGERRWRAAGIAGLQKVPVLVRTPSDQHRLELSLIENVQRRDLSPLETAAAYQRLKDQFNLSLEAIGQRVGGKSMSAVSNTIRLLNLPTSAKKALVEGNLTEGQARPLLALADNPNFDAIVTRIVEEGWSSRRIEQYVSGLKKAGAHVRIAVPAPARYEHFSKSLTKTLSAKVTIKKVASGGKVVINFKDDADLERIQSLLDK